MEEKNNEFTIRDLINIIVPKLWIVAIVSVIVSVAVGIYSSYFVKDTYSTTVQFYVHFGATEANSIELEKARQLVPVYISAYKSRAFGDELLTEVKKSSYVKDNEQYKKLEASTLLSMLSFSQDDKVPIMNITVTANDDDLVKTVAEALTSLSYDFSVEEGEDENVENDTVLPIHNLVPHKAEFQIYQRAAELPYAPNAKNVERNVIISFFAAAIVTLAGIVTLALLDVTIRDRKKLENGVNIPVLGVIPKYESAKNEGRKY